MKKRILSVIFAALMLSACAFGFAACGEQTTIGTPQDNETEQGDHGDNTQGGGTENDPQGGNEPAVRTTVTEEEWNAALRLDGVRNVTVDGELVYPSYPIYHDMRMVYTIKLNDNILYLDGRTKYGEDPQEEPGIEICYEILEILDGYDEMNTDPFFSGQYYANVFEKNDSGLWEEYQRDFFWSSEKSPFLFITTLLSLFCIPYGQFTYNDDLQQYEANNIVLTSFPIDSLQAPSMEISFDSIVFQFQNGRLVKYEGVLSQEQWLEMSAKSFSLLFTDYGTTSVTLPEVSVE